MKNYLKFFKKIKLIAVAIACLSLVALAAKPVMAVDVIGSGCENVPDASLCQSNKNQPKEGNEIYGRNGILTKATNIISILVGAAAVVVIIIGGIRYVIASGDPSNLNGAKNAILFALIGLLVAGFAQAIVVFVLSRIP